MRRFLRALLTATLLALPPSLAAGVAGSPATDPEPALEEIIRAIESDRLDEALKRTDRLLESHPTFRLGHLIRGDLLLAKARPLHQFGDAEGVPPAELADLREEALARLKAYRNRPRPGLVPRSLLALSPDQEHAVVVDTDSSRLFVFRNDSGSPRYVADYYISQGKAGAEKSTEGDKRTPIGVYFVTSAIPAADLPDFYGSGAYPINYPNEWDRRLGRKGYGIWLHGSPPDTYSRPPRASDGCVVLANADLDALSDYVTPGQTPVIIGHDIEWLDPAAWRAERSTLVKRIEAWRQDWESRDTSRYLRHYATDFRSDAHDIRDWGMQKRRMNASKDWIRITLSNLSMFRSPGADDLVVVTFDQHFRSNDLNSDLRKRQYWVRRDGTWKIAYEGAL